MSWIVACLCAEWCSTCRAYRPVFDEAAARVPSVRFAWIDVEDDPVVAGDLEIETFPTLLIASGGEVAFFGTVTPHAATLASLAERASQGALGRVTDAEILEVAQRAQAWLERKEGG